MSDNRIYDAINLFKYSQIGQGTAHIGGDAAYQARYRQLAFDIVNHLWRLWAAGEIKFAALWPNIVGDSAPDHPGPDLRINRRIEPSSNRTTYARESEQGKLAATSGNLVHEATHLVTKSECYAEEEVLCRTIQGLYFRELRAGRSYDSRVTGTRLTARYGPYVPFFGVYAVRDIRLRNQDLIDNVFSIPEYRTRIHPSESTRELERRVTASFIVRSLRWWGGLANRWPSTRGYYLRSLAAQPHDYSEQILQILESLTRTQWPAARSCLGSFARIQQGLRLTGGMRLGRQVIYTDLFAERVRAVQERLGESFGVDA